jgi:uncharacterized hydrophobic protein (TIGR00271 family)
VLPIRFSKEPPIPSKELLEGMQAAAAPSVGFYLMLSIASLLATLGLVVDSVAVIIGAMIVAPLMNPIMATAYAITRGNRDLLVQAVFTLVTGVFLVIGVSMAVVFVISYGVQGREIVARANPNLIDLGVAFGSGLAGAYAWSHRKIGNALPGVAISVALVPPLCVVGIGLMAGELGMLDFSQEGATPLSTIASGAALLFLTNLAAIVLSGSVVFLLHGYGSWSRARTGIFASIIIVVLISIPLAISFDRIHFRNSLMRALNEISVDHPEWADARLARIRVDYDRQPVVFAIRVEAPVGLIDLRDVAAIEKALVERLKEQVEVEITVLEFKTLKSDGIVPEER